MLTKITVKGAREHNLKNVDVEIPRDKLVVITGLSNPRLPLIQSTQRANAVMWKACLLMPASS